MSIEHIKNHLQKYGLSEAYAEAVQEILDRKVSKITTVKEIREVLLKESPEVPILRVAVELLTASEQDLKPRPPRISMLLAELALELAEVDPKLDLDQREGLIQTVAADLEVDGDVTTHLVDALDQVGVFAALEKHYR